MREVSSKSGHKVVAFLVLVAVITCAAGLHHQRAKRNASIDWHDVSVALMEVEKAKTDLHQSMQQRITREQQGANGQVN